MKKKLLFITFVAALMLLAFALTAGAQEISSVDPQFGTPEIIGFCSRGVHGSLAPSPGSEPLHSAWEQTRQLGPKPGATGGQCVCLGQL